jgi:predicted ATPase
MEGEMGHVLLSMPASFPRIQRLRPSGFLSFSEGFAGVVLADLNVLVGPNGSGKSNFIDAARFLAAAPKGLSAFLTQGGGVVADWCFRDGRFAAVEVIATGPGRPHPLRYQLELANAREPRILAETLEAAGGAKARVFLHHEVAGIRLRRRTGAKTTLPLKELDPSLPVIEQIKDARAYPEMAWIRRHLDGYRFFGEAHFGRLGNELRRPQNAAQPQEFLLEDGSNLPLIVNAMFKRSGFRQRLLEHVQELYPHVEEVEVDFSMGFIQLIFIEKGHQRYTPAARLSDGTMRWLFLGALLLDDTATTPLFLDEPELALHPDAFIPLGRLLREASRHRQVTVTTHSAALLSEFGASPEVVHVFDRTDEGTRVTRLDRQELQSWLRDHTLGEVWASGRIGGNRW